MASQGRPFLLVRVVNTPSFTRLKPSRTPKELLWRGAEVTATNTETGVATVVKTSDIGIFYFSSLHPSRYKIVVKAAGPRVWKEHCVAGYLGDRKQIVLVPTPTILDNLIAAKRIPAMVALLLGNAPGARDRELTCNPAFSDFLSSELLPWAHGLYNFTADPRQTVVGGSSFGGLAATCAGLHHPEMFGNILSQSGSFFWVPPKSDSSDSDIEPEPNWVAKQFIASARLPLRFYLDAGSEEIDLSGGGRSILLTNRSLRDVLRARGYELHYQEFAGGHDYLSWRGTLADGLIALMGGASTQPGQESAVKP